MNFLVFMCNIAGRAASSFFFTIVAGLFHSLFRHLIFRGRSLGSALLYSVLF